MYRLKFLLPFIVINVFTLNAQNLIFSELIGSAGEQSNIGTYSISSSIGEAVVSSENSELIQNSGFQQGYNFTTSVFGHDQRLLIKVYPNPFYDHVYIDFSGIINTNKQFVFELFDLHGKKIIEHQLSTNLLKHNFSIPLLNLKPGIYFARISDGNLLSKTFKLIH